MAWESPLEAPEVSLEDPELAGLDLADLIDIDKDDLWREVPNGGARGRPADGPPPLEPLPPGLAEDFAGRLRRAGAKTGDVQVSLMWNNINDLDLNVLCPSGERIFFAHRQSFCGGVLDVDMNVRGSWPRSEEPVENIYWPSGRAPWGRFAVAVDHYSNNGAPDPTRFWVNVKVPGREVKTYEGTISFGQRPRIVCRFENRVRRPEPVKRGTRANR